MKAVLISIRPEWCTMIANGEKTVEVRKTRPKLETPFKVYIYCSKGGPLLYLSSSHCFGNGSVIGEFVCDRIYQITVEENGPFSEERSCGYNEAYTLAGENDALTDEEFDRYLGGRPGYGWHISDLTLYGKMKSLPHFVRPACERASDCGTCSRWDANALDCERGNIVFRAPQSWCYVEALP